MIGVVAINATTPQYRPFEDNDMPGKIVLKQYPFENKIQQKMNNEYKLYQRTQKVTPIIVDPSIYMHHSKTNNEYRGNYIIPTNQNDNSNLNNSVTISQQNVQYYNYRENINSATNVKYNTPINIKIKTKDNIIDETIIATNNAMFVAPDSNPDEGWGEQVEDDDDIEDGPIGDAILPLLMFILLYFGIRRKA